MLVTQTGLARDIVTWPRCSQLGTRRKVCFGPGVGARVVGLSVGKHGLIKIRRYLSRCMSVTQRYPNMASMFTVGDKEEGMFGA